jgi:hypothetical protein
MTTKMRFLGSFTFPFSHAINEPLTHFFGVIPINFHKVTQIQESTKNDNHLTFADVPYWSKPHRGIKRNGYFFLSSTFFCSVLPPIFFGRGSSFSSSRSTICRPKSASTCLSIVVVGTNGYIHILMIQKFLFTSLDCTTCTYLYITSPSATQYIHVYIKG